MEEKANSRALKGPDTQAPHRLWAWESIPWPPAHAFSPDPQTLNLWCRPFLKSSFLVANLLLLALGLHAFLAPDIFGKETTLCVPERASPEKYDPVPEDTAIGLFLSGTDRGIWLNGHGKVRVPFPTLGPL